MNAHFALLAAVLLVGIAHDALAVKDDGPKSVGQLWSEWKVQYGKKYSSPDEEARRFVIFESKKKRMDEHNALYARGEVPYALELSQFSDLTAKELMQLSADAIRNKNKSTTAT